MNEQDVSRLVGSSVDLTHSVTFTRDNLVVAVHQLLNGLDLFRRPLTSELICEVERGLDNLLSDLHSKYPDSVLNIVEAAVTTTERNTLTTERNTLHVGFRAKLGITPEELSRAKAFMGTRATRRLCDNPESLHCPCGLACGGAL